LYIYIYYANLQHLVCSFCFPFIAVALSFYIQVDSVSACIVSRVLDLLFSVLDQYGSIHLPVQRLTAVKDVYDRFDELVRQIAGCFEVT